ncbi:glycoside hydrolase family 9 protein, partial [Longimicrobium sp.]|uniref:glycoside hydrolase family 9 protein n=1 Tax=Longimicrobium sp. TaxID=2029185 RepID=UPI002E36C0D2
MFAALPLILALWAAGSAGAQTAQSGERAWIRVNQLGYLPNRPKVAVLCALDSRPAGTFTVVDARGRTVLRGRATDGGAFGPCASAHRLDFSRVRAAGTYTLVADGVRSPAVRINADVYTGAADSLLAYMRQQRSGWNPLFRDSVHARTDGILVDHPEAGAFIDVAGGWADAADYLQYVTTSANATWLMLMAYRDHPSAFADLHAADGLPGANGTPDVLDEARHGLEWLLKMYPRDDLLLNQLGDDRDHSFPDLPTNDSSDYGWGRGGHRPVYPCTGRPQGLLTHRNRSDGMASTAGKMASAFALGARLFAERDPAFAALLARKAEAAYALGRANPGVCQTAPARAPYFYEEENWADDMELAAAALGALTGRPAYRDDALRFARMEPVTPWMGADTALHYQWYPWHNNG